MKVNIGEENKEKERRNKKTYTDGCRLGCELGCLVGSRVGCCVGCLDGCEVGYL